MENQPEIIPASVILLSERLRELLAQNKNIVLVQARRSGITAAYELATAQDIDCEVQSNKL